MAKRTVSPLEVIRALQSKDLELSKKIEAAWDALPLLGESGAPASVPGGQLGLLHFVRFMFQWSLSTLTKAATEGQRKRLFEVEDSSKERSTSDKKIAKRRKIGEHAESAVGEAKLEQPERGEAPGFLDVRLWEVLKASLSSERLGSDALISPAILQAISAVLSSDTLCPATAGDLGQTIGEVLEILAARFARSFRPSLEQWTAAVQVAINCLVASSPKHPKLFIDPAPFHKTILLLVRGLNATCRSHPNPRKAFTLLVGRLLRPVLKARFCLLGVSLKTASDGLVNFEESETSTGELVQALESLLEGGLFTVTQVGGYAGVCQSLESNADDLMNEIVAVDEEEAGPKKKRKKQGAATEQDEEIKGKLASYHRLLFQELEAGVNEHDQAVIGSLDWFLRAYAAAMEGDQKGDGGLAVRDDAKGDLDTEDAPPSESAHPEAPRRKKVPQSEALFRVFAQLMRPLLQQMQAGRENAEALVGLVRGCQLLVTAANEVRAYIPTEDTPSRSHFRFLTTLKTSVLGLSESISPSPTNSNQEEAKPLSSLRAMPQGKSALVGQILSFLAVIVETEYRVIDEDLTLVWRLLLQAADGGGAIRGVESPPPNVDEWLAQNAVKLGARLLEVYGDLRQVERILTNLTEALGTHAAHLPRLVCSAPFLKALSRVVQRLPMGQAAPLIRMVARDQQALLERVATGDTLASIAAATELHVSILDHIHVSEGNAVAIGAASRAVLHSAVAPTLGPKLLTWSLSSSQFTQFKESGQKSKRRKVPQEANGTISQVKGGNQAGLEESMLLRIFLSVNSLHYHAVSLMPPTAAKKAEAAVLGLEGNPTFDQILSINEQSIFASIGCGQLQVSRVVEGLGTSLTRNPALRYAVDCLVLQELERLSRLGRQIELRLDSESDPVALHAGIASLLRVFFPESKRHLPQNSKQSKLETSRQATPSQSDGSDDVVERINGWDGVVSNLTEASYAAAKWRLLCDSVDVWGPLASSQNCKPFLIILLDTARTEGAQSKVSLHDRLQGEATAPFSSRNHLEEKGASLFSIDVETSLEKQMAQEASQDLVLNELPTLISVSACSQQLLRDADFYELPAFQSLLPGLLLAELQSASADVMTSAESGGAAEVRPPLERADAPLRFLGQLEGGYMQPQDVGGSLKVLMEHERNLLLGAQSQQEVPSDKSALLSHIVLCRTTMSRILANNLAVLFPSPAAAALGDEKQTAFSETFWGREQVEGLLTAAQGCVMAAVNGLEDTVVPNIASTKEAVHTLALSALQAVSFAPLRAAVKEEAAQVRSTEGAMAERVSKQRDDKQADGFFDTLIEVLLEQCEETRKFLSVERSRRQSEAERGPPRTGPNSMLPRTVRLGAKQRGSAETGVSKSGAEKVVQPETKWVEAASAIANAGAVLRALGEILDRRDQACRAGREAKMTWQAPEDTWKDVIGRLEGAVTDCLSMLTEEAGSAGADESKTVEGEYVATKGRRVLRGSLKGLEQSLSRKEQSQGQGTTGQEQTTVSKNAQEVAGGLLTVLLSDESKAATLKHVLLGELFAAVGSVIRIRCLLASPHVVQPTGGSNEIEIVESADKEGQEKHLCKDEDTKAARKRRQADARNGDLDESEAPEEGPRTKRRKKSEKEVVSAETGTPEHGVQADAHNGSTALEALGCHLAAADDVLTTLVQPFESFLNGSQHTVDIVQCVQIVSSVVHYLEAAGRSFPLLSPAPPIAAFDWLVERHLALLAVPPASTLEAQDALLAVRLAAEASLGTLIRGASRQQLLQVIQTVESDLIEQQRSEAAVRALAVLLEYVSGPKSLRLLANHSPRLLSVLFSLIQSGAATSPRLLTSGLHVLTTFVSRESQFHLTSAHVGLVLSIPSRLFLANQLLPRGSESKTLSQKPSSEPDLLKPATSAQSDDVECATFCASSKLLQAVLRHRPKEARRCAALLVGSLQAMLQMVATWSQQKGQERSTVTACASLRRVYEEVSHHKASLSHYCVHMLADYLAALCGLTASKDAISREAASTLRSGIFALFDSCSPYELQQLHASLGADGTRRNALTALRQDYEKRHKYTGKV